MADKVTKSLDDIIKDNRANRAGNKRGGGSGGPAGRRGGRGGAASAAGGGGGRFRGTSLPRRQNGGGAIQKRRSGGASLSPRKAASSINDQWTHDLFQGVAPSSGGATKLIVSNLDFGVNDNDIQNLFQEFGRLKKAAVHYDRSARSLGTAEVIFERRADGIRAMNHYNGVSLDGRPMKIEVVGATAKPVVVAPIVSGGGNPRRSNGGGAPGGGGNRSFRGGNRGGRGGAGGSGGRGGRREPKQTKTAEELDAELDAHQHQMQTE